MNTILKLEHIQKYYGNEGNITKAIKDIRLGGIMDVEKEKNCFSKVD